MGWFSRFFSHDAGRFGPDELARRLDVSSSALEAIRPEYRELAIPKRTGGVRKLSIPSPELLALQRRLLRRVFGRLRAHSAACGFERGRSIVDHARPHVGRAVVMKFDVRDFFTSTTAARLEKYFGAIGWDRAATKLLLKLCAWQGSLPQGAPTSPRLSNLVNFALDARLTAAAERIGAQYTRYADDITFSLDDDKPVHVADVIQTAAHVIHDFGYRLNKRKTRIMRAHQRQQITGLVVNETVALPRTTRRLLRAVEHRRRLQAQLAASPEARLDLRQAPAPTLTDSQLAGWHAFQQMLMRDPPAI